MIPPKDLLLRLYILNLRKSEKNFDPAIVCINLMFKVDNFKDFRFMHKRQRPETNREKNARVMKVALKSEKVLGRAYYFCLVQKID